ncbi:MAG: selenocysteine-specific translation elongation factor [Bacteroidales bacterium]|jgi:selenocysteine-specific elongation factor|nr:selenocysteine-specific translation elongation factor [Bacteroidales bacterium]
MKHLIIGTAGHVDHGKTALIKALTGIDCDTHKEEKERGITINLGFSHLDLPDGESIGIVDVPGHKDFIKTMVAGAHGIDIVLLVIAADSGIMPQTREHMRIVEMLGVKKGVVALTKTDLVDDEMLELAKLEVMEFLEGSAIDDAAVIGVSSRTGDGIDMLKSEVQKLVASVEVKVKTGNFRLYIDRMFNVKGIGFVATGTVINGEVEVGKEVYLLPGRSKKVKIRGIEKHGKPVDKVIAGDRAAINIAGIKAEDFKRGMILSDKPLVETSMIDASITMFDNDIRLGIWSNAIFYSGTFECMARIHLIDKDMLTRGETAIAQIHLDTPAVLINKDNFILRNTSSDLSIGGGTILDTKPLHHKKRTDRLIENMKTLANAVLHAESLYELVASELKKERLPVLLEKIAPILEVQGNEIMTEILESDRTDIVHYSIAGKHILIDHNTEQNFQEKVFEEIGAWHEKHPFFAHGLNDKELSGKLGFAGKQLGLLYTAALLKKMQTEGKIIPVNETWALAGHRARMDAKTKDQIDWVDEELRNAGMEKPLMAELEKSALERKITKEQLKTMLVFLANEGKVYFFENDFIHADIVDRARKMLLAELVKKEMGINEKEFRELINGTKKVVQVLLGIFLQEGIVTKETYYIHITEKGKSLINK